ncbi:hypothetical protein [Curtobacterium oceanosedimentum]|uniref:hypothetical protein n=1 Tax=Curtobacterium oceanosedimentum TaxID=465820 RepID=UPI000A891EDE|nr:hypothetical protein [Curtobacterium oceanosedimentum]
MTSPSNRTRSPGSVNLITDRIDAWCRTALLAVKTIISIIRAVKHLPFDLPGFLAQ